MKKRIFSLLICIVMLVSVLPMPVFAAKQPAAMSEKFTITAADTDIPDNDELFAGYVDKMFSGRISSSATFGTLAREKLSARDKVVYDCLKPGIVSVANGETASTTFPLDNATINSTNPKTTWTLSELGYSSMSEAACKAAVTEYLNQFDAGAIFHALLNDFPYELYWFDKTEGLYWWAYYEAHETEIYVSDLTFSFSVSEDYQSYNYDPENPTVDTELTGATAASVANAKAIVNEYAALDDYNKLLAYNNEIMDLVDYNYDAIEYDYAYGDPWQLVYVFDGDSSTDVVCEGYSKAFQYLCDLSNFDNDIRCYSVTGIMGYAYSEGGAHMWNTVTMEDGKNYLVDVTNSEAGSVGENGEFFLAGASGSIDDGYIISASGSDFCFRYDGETVYTWGSGSGSPLYLAGTSYVPQQVHKHSYTAVVTAPTCTEDGYTTYTCDCGDSYIDDIVPAAHSWDEGIVTVEPTEEAEGEMLYTCTVCGETKTETLPVLEHVHNFTFVGVVDPSCELPGGDLYTCDSCGENKFENEVPALGHSWSDWVIIDEATETEEGLRERTCSRCGETETDWYSLNPFVDVSKEDYYYEPVLWAVANDITTGVDETHFAPNNTCTRAQVVTFLWRAAGEPEPVSQDHPFTDLEDGAYYCNAVLWAVENGITTGTSNTTFEPDSSCTRAQVATFLWRAVGEPKPTTQNHPFTDLDADQYYYDAVLWAVENEITTGTTSTTFEPNATCTRGQIVTFLYRAYA